MAIAEDKDYNPKTWFICDVCNNKYPKSEGYRECQDCKATMCCGKCARDHTLLNHEPEYVMKYK